MKILDFIRQPSRILISLDVRGVRFLSDEMYLKLLYKIVTGKRLNIKEPRTFNEKLQWLKLNDRKEIYTDMVDKYEAKKVVEDRIGKEYVVETYGVYDCFEEIDFDSLPEKFVLKCTHDCGGLVICRDKSKLDKDEARKKINKCLKKNYYFSSREWPYKNVKPRIIAEKYLENMSEDSELGIVDYKWFCFGGEPKFLYVSQGLEEHSTARISFYDMEFNKMPFSRSDYKGFEEKPFKPTRFDEMKEIARKLAKDIPFVRIDLYEINGNIYFSEITFYPCSGMIPFTPAEWDYELGNLLDLKVEKM